MIEARNEVTVHGFRVHRSGFTGSEFWVSEG